MCCDPHSGASAVMLARAPSLRQISPGRCFGVGAMTAATAAVVAATAVAQGCSRSPCHAACAAGEVILGDLFRSGFTITDVADEADAIVVNTCGFVEDAKAESLDVGAFCLSL